ncbi:hypothetical protein HB780_08890 (plasmid) [Rhizobium lusitanum]|nr:hypothetical protein [Rhizobium lusitanum]QND45825.1 hypothetical protein HB780_08890 [Rhizobium lusitanum]
MSKSVALTEKIPSRVCRSSEQLDFFRAWIANPLRVASVVPSSSHLAMAITQEISAATGGMLELGPGNGPTCPVPRRLLDRLGLKAVRLSWTYANFPPASVYKITRRQVLN